MYLNVGYHLHGYQPGDVVLIEDSSPFEPIRYVERQSPLSLSVAGTEVYGRNWTDAVLNGYKLFPDALKKLSEEKEKLVSIDIEPFTLQMYANKFGLTALLELLSIFDKNVDFVSTPPFHTPLTLMHRIEQELLSKIMWQIHISLFEKYKGEGDDAQIYGVWLPENLYTTEVASSVTDAFASVIYHDPNLRTKKPRMYFILDKRQFIQPAYEHYLYSLNFTELAGTKVFLFGRIPELSDIFAFNKSDVSPGEFVSEIIAKLRARTDNSKEMEHIEYLITLSSDLESLVSNGLQIEKFRTLMHDLKKEDMHPMAISAYIYRKLKGICKKWPGEGETEEFKAKVKENSSWSDYADMLIEGKTSDTRWTGMRRADGKVVSRKVGKYKVSQIWKQGYNQMLYIATRCVRNNVFQIISMETGVKNKDVISNFLVLYNRIYFKPIYLAVGVDKSTLTYEHIAQDTIGLSGNHEKIAKCARAYYHILAANRSCSRFWDIIDTRVTFQSTVYAVQSIIDLIKLYGVGTPPADTLFKFFTTEFLNFRSNYGRYGLGALYGAEGWEVTEPAWLSATQSYIPEVSTYDVVRRAAIFTAVHNMPSEYLCRIQYEKDQACADTAHISGELHGKWENIRYCEHRK